MLTFTEPKLIVERQWLSSRPVCLPKCEWKAELAEIQLLDGLITEENLEKPKPGKKSKKKKAKNPAAVTTNGSVNENGNSPKAAVEESPDEAPAPAPTLESSNSVESQDEKAIESDATMNAPVDDEMKEPSPTKPSLSVSTATEEDKTNGDVPGIHERDTDLAREKVKSESPSSITNGHRTEIDATTEVDKTAEDTVAEEPSGLSDQDIDSFIKIGVYDKSAFQSAEEFLVGRLLTVLKE
jgi:hypothetical protein